jgi:Uma2 family endonuclease
MSTATLPETIGDSAANGEALYEVVNGQRVELPPMSIYAIWIASRLHVRLGSFAEEQACGTAVAEGLFILDPVHDIRRRPDVAFVSAATWSLDRPLPETGDWAIVPDLAVEVVSPNDGFEDVIAKVDEYFQCGVKNVWVILPTLSKVFVFELASSVRLLTVGDTLEGGALLPGFRLNLTELFKKPAAVTGK